MVLVNFWRYPDPYQPFLIRIRIRNTGGKVFALGFSLIHREEGDPCFGIQFSMQRDDPCAGIQFNTEGGGGSSLRDTV